MKILLTGRHILSVIFFVALQSAQAQFKIRADTVATSPTFGQFSVKGDFPKNDSQDWYQSAFKVRVKGARTFLLGSYHLSSDQLSFTPKFSPDPNSIYVVEFQLEGESKLYSAEFSFSNSLPPTNLLSVFPSDSLPANALRIYLKFDQPMSLQNPFDFIDLSTESGEVMKDAFVEYNEGLWNKNRTRLTLLFHPGRVKRGVGPNEVMGPIFEQGNRYKLVVKEGWKDQNGNPILNQTNLSWVITEDIRSKIELSDWEVIAPDKNEGDLVVTGDGRTMDEEIFNKQVVVENQGREIEGRWKITGNTYTFYPARDWSAGEYGVIIPAVVEDVSGNAVMSAFDTERKMNLPKSRPKRISFSIE